MSDGNHQDEPPEPPPPAAGGYLRRLIYLLFGLFFVALGVLGVILPGLPATPFLLLASYFLLHSFPALNERMLRSPMIGPLLRDWQEHKGIRPHVKFKAVIIIVAALTLTTLFGDLGEVLLLVVLALGAVGIVVVLCLPRVREPAQYCGTEPSTSSDQASMPPASETTSVSPD